MSLQLVQPTRAVSYGNIVRDQFAAFAGDGYTKTSGLNPSVDMTTAVYLNGAVVGAPPTVTIAEIGSSGEYAMSFTPNQVGVWVVEVRIPTLSQTWKGQYDVQGVVPGGQNFYDVVRDEHGNGVPYVLVEVLAASTPTVLYSTQTAFDGSYTIPLSGALASNPLVDLRFSGNLIQTLTKSGIKLA